MFAVKCKSETAGINESSQERRQQLILKMRIEKSMSVLKPVIDSEHVQNERSDLKVHFNDNELFNFSTLSGYSSRVYYLNSCVFN